MQRQVLTEILDGLAKQFVSLQGGGGAQRRSQVKRVRPQALPFWLWLSLKQSIQT